MAIQRRKHKKSQNDGGLSSIEKSKSDQHTINKKIDPTEKKTEQKQRQDAIAMHLPPFPLVVLTLLCSGFLWMLAFRDMMATGRPLLGSMDEDFLVSFASDFFGIEFL